MSRIARRSWWLLVLGCAFAACESDSDSSDGGDEDGDKGGASGATSGGAGGRTNGGTAGSGGLGGGGVSGSTTGGLGGAAGMGGSVSGEAGASVSGGTGGDAGGAGEGGTGEGGMGGEAGDSPTCAAGGATDHVNDAVPCASATTCDVDALGRRWSPPIRIDDGTGCASGPLRVAQPSADRGFVAWSDANPSRVRARRNGAGAAWSAIEELGDGWGADLDAASGGTALLLLGTRDNQAFSRATALAATSFGAASTLTSALARNDPRTELAVDSTSQGLALWAEGAVSFRYSTWTSAAGWAAAATMPSDFIRAAITPMPGGGFALAGINTGSVYLRLYRPGSGWGVGEVVNGFDEPTAANEATVNVAVDALGYIHVAYTFPILNEPYAQILYDERNPNGTWQTTRGFTTGGDVDAREKPLLAVSDEGDVILGWRRANSTQREMAVAVREGRSWTEPRELDNFNTVIHPAVAMDATGNALVVWGREETDFGLVRANRYIAGSGWDNSTYLVLHDDMTANAATHLQAAMSPTGQALVAYVVRKTGEPDRVFANTLR